MMPVTCHVLLRAIAPVIFSLMLLISLSPIVQASFMADAEYHGQLSTELAASTEDLDQVVFKPSSELAKEAESKQGVRISTGLLYDPLQDKSSLSTALVESPDADPFIYVDLNNDRVMQADERIALKRAEADNPYIWQAIILLPMKSSLFQNYPVFIQYYKDVKMDEMKEGERLVLQSREAFARATVDLAGRQTLVQYIFDPRAKKLNPSRGILGIDCNGDGKIETDRFSPESADANDETVVFHVGEHYVSTKRVDLEKREVVLREHPASDYKRIELAVGSEMPDFAFTDFNGKKRKLSEFRGKYVLVDFWAVWCGPCRRELPIQKFAYSRFASRGFEILGMNNDPDPKGIKPWLEKNGLTWPQATMESIRPVEMRYRIHLFPTTLLLGPDGKVISLNQRGTDQPPIRGTDLLKSLDHILPR